MTADWLLWAKQWSNWLLRATPQTFPFFCKAQCVRPCLSITVISWTQRGSCSQFFISKWFNRKIKRQILYIIYIYKHWNMTSVSIKHKPEQHVIYWNAYGLDHWLLGSDWILKITKGRLLIETLQAKRRAWEGGAWHKDFRLFFLIPVSCSAPPGLWQQNGCSIRSKGCDQLCHTIIISHNWISFSLCFRGCIAAVHTRKKIQIKKKILQYDSLCYTK